MAYIEYSDYTYIYGEGLSEADFNRLDWDAERLVDIQVTGIDDINKLSVAFPTVEKDAEAVKRCICKLIDTLSKIESIEATMIPSSNGALQSGGLVASRSSGSESISYATGFNATLTQAVTDEEVKTKLINTIVRNYLSAVCDKNGVHLLYRGVYPYAIPDEE